MGSGEWEVKFKVCGLKYVVCINELWCQMICLGCMKRRDVLVLLCNEGIIFLSFRRGVQVVVQNER